MRHNYFSTSITEETRRIHRTKELMSPRVLILQRDLSFPFSIDLSSREINDPFYGVESEDNRLDHLLRYDSFSYFNYDFDRILTQVMADLCYTGKAYVEIAYVKDADDNIKGLDLIPFDAVKLISLKGSSFFVVKVKKNRFRILKIPTYRIAEFALKDVGLKKNYFKKLVRRLTRMDRNRSMDLLNDKKISQIYDYSKISNREELLMVKYPHKIGWLGGDYQNKYRNESYNLYSHIKYKSFRKKCLEYMLGKINTGIENMCGVIGIEGKIVVRESILDYEKEWEQYSNGEICTSELISRVIGK